MSKFFRRRQDDLPCVYTTAADGLLVRVHTYDKPCGHPGYALELRAHLASRDEWLTIGMVAGEDAHAMLRLLTEAVQFLDRQGSKRFQRELVDD